MPPKKPKQVRKPAPALSQEDQTKAAIGKLSSVLSKADKTKGLIKVPSTTLQAINKLLKEYREQKETIDLGCVYEFIDSLDDNDNDNLCKYFDPETFCTVLQIILQMESSKEAERGLHLLAASLFEASIDYESSDNLNYVKDTIGTASLGQLVNFFVHGDKSYGMQRWAGLLCIQLVSDCDNNRTKLENIPEDIRRSIGRKVLEETDEILRVIFALLIRTMTDKGTPVGQFYPKDYATNASADFPLSTQDNVGWGVRFQSYMDNVFNKTGLVPPVQIGELLFAASVYLTPGGPLGARHHNNMVFVDDDYVTFMATCRDGHFDSILEIPKSSINSMAFETVHNSQTNSHRVVINIEEGGEIEDDEESCYLDSKAVRLNKLAFSIESNSKREFEKAVLANQSHIEISDSTESQHNAPRNSQATKKKVREELGESQDRPIIALQADLTAPNDIYDLQESQQLLTSRNGRSQSQVPSGSSVRFDDVALETNVEETAMEDPNEADKEDLYGASPKVQQRKIASPEVRTVIPAATRGRKAIKPKAKPPIVATRSSLGSQLTTAMSKSQVTEAKTTEGPNTQSKIVKAGTAKAGSATTKSAPSNTSANRGAKRTPSLKKATKTSAGKPAPKKTARSGTTKLKNVPVIQLSNPAYNFSDVSIAHDTSPPQAKVSTNDTKNKGKAVKSQSESKLPTADSTSIAPRKKYGLPKPVDSASKGEFEQIKKPQDTKKLPTSKDKQSKAKLSESQQPNAKKRQSAPTALPATRQSQRTATSKAKDKMQGADDSYDEEPGNLSFVKSKSKPAENKKNTTSQKPPKEPLPKNNSVAHESHTVSEDQDMYEIQAEDARSLGLAPGTSQVGDQGEEENLYDASPQTTKRAELPAKTPKKLEFSAANGPKKARDSGVDIAKKLINSLGLMDSDSENVDEPQRSGPVKSVAAKKEKAGPREPRKNMKSPGEKMAVETTGDDAEVEPFDEQDDVDIAPLDQQAEVEVDHQNHSSLERERTPPHANANASPTVSPIALLMEDLTTPIAEDPVPEEIGESSSPIVQETIQIEQRTQVLTTIVQDVPKQKVPMHGSNSGLIATSKGRASKQITVTETQEVEVIEAIPKKSKSAAEMQLDIVENGKIVEEFEDLEGVFKKRKTPTEMDVPVKRRRIEEESLPEVQDQVTEPEPAQAPKAASKTSRNPKPTSPMAKRRSPRLATKLARPAAELKLASPKVSSVTKDPSRKPQVINFSSKGPQNQGLSSAIKQKDKVVPFETREEPSLPELPLADRKRKREKTSLSGIVSPPKKKPNSSPDGPDVNNTYNENVNPVIHGSSPDAPFLIKPHPVRQERISKPSSQASRVDRNGSPIAAENTIDHIRKLRKSLGPDQAQHVPEYNEQLSSTAAEIPEERVLRHRAADIFGPKIHLANKSKIRPSSPGEPNSRYILHGELHGIYTDVDTQKVLEEEKALADPFLEGGRRTSGFIERLQSSTSNKAAEKIKGKSRMYSGHSNFAQSIPVDNGRLDTESRLPVLPREKISNRGRPILGLLKEPARLRKHASEVSSPSDMTTGTSYISHSSDVTRTPLQEMTRAADDWSLAVRPHYKNLGQRVHRAADELMIRLSTEEDKMDLLVNQYKDNATKMLDNVGKKRETQRGAINRNLELKKSELASVYNESRGDIMETELSMRDDSTSHFEADWQRKQNSILKQIAEGRKLSDD